ncbi:heme utilization protein HutZ [Vibrio sp. S4M6]|uniref:heme utilization protein HutZ n=1 Tax=Vibrio sinus TaxID=2946865 RepID=UPI002029C76F|nr:heme utilization protein HutZ [Vibrio sinus]MCL9780010.1 heme utilization protein HutZ [Vibrio sinus]
MTSNPLTNKLTQDPAQAKETRLQEHVRSEIQEFIQHCESLQLATVNEQQQPNISYAPFVHNQYGYFILISTLARHARNIDNNPTISFMMIEDESKSTQIYARKRLTFEASANSVMRDTEMWQQVIDELAQRFGDIIDDLKQLSDFNLYQLHPKQGLFVKGFGQAFQCSGDELLDIAHVKRAP